MKTVAGLAMRLNQKKAPVALPGPFMLSPDGLGLRFVPLFQTAAGVGQHGVDLAGV